MAYWFLGGIGLLVVVLVLGQWFVRANPSTLAQRIRRIGGYLLAALAAIFLLAGRLPLAAMCGAGAALLLGWRGFTPSGGGAGGAGPTPGASSQVDTDWLAMTLDHASGGFDGTVKKGVHAGRRLGELTQEQIIEVLAECHGQDAQSATLLETYLDRVHGTDWRGGEAPRQESPPPRPGGGQMTRAEALQVLGLGAEATAVEIKDAHHRLMLKVHPDQGGSDYLAAKLNEAKDVLLGH